MEIKDIIRKKRLEKGFTMKELADMTGVSEATISRWESGNIATMKQTKIEALAKALNISPVVLVSGTDNNPAEPAPAVLLTEAEREHLEQYRQLTEENKNAVDDFIDYHLSRQNEQLKKESISG